MRTRHDMCFDQAKAFLTKQCIYTSVLWCSWLATERASDL